MCRGISLLSTKEAKISTWSSLPEENEKSSRLQISQTCISISKLGSLICGLCTTATLYFSPTSIKSIEITF